MAKKISRKQLLKEPDEFITFSGKLIRLIQKYQKQITMAIGIVIALFLILSIVKIFSNRAEDTSFALLSQANNKYKSILSSKDALTALKEVEKDFEHIINEYSKYQGGKIAGINLANYCYQAAEYERASGLYETALKNFGENPYCRNFILSGLAYSYMAKKDYENSVKYLELMVSSDIPLLKDEALFNLSKLYEILGKADKKNEVLNKIVSDYPESVYLEIAKDQLHR